MLQSTRVKFLKQIELVEGRRYKMYMLDNIPHIGIGHNIISRQLTDETLEYLGCEDEPDLMTAELSDDQIEYLFFKDLDIAINDARKAIGKEVFESLSEERQEVLVDMSFNLGGPRFRAFKNMIKAVQEGDYDEAAAEILDSKAARDPKTAKRYADLSNRMLGEKKLLVDKGLDTFNTEKYGEKETNWELLVDIRDILSEINAKLDTIVEHVKSR